MTVPEKMIAFIIPNEDSKASLQQFMVSVDAVEKETGLDFFPLLPAKKQAELESTIMIDAWVW